MDNSIPVLLNGKFELVDPSTLLQPWGKIMLGMEPQRVVDVHDLAGAYLNLIDKCPRRRRRRPVGDRKRAIRGAVDSLKSLLKKRRIGEIPEWVDLDKRNKWIEKKYGITSEEYNRIYENQKGSCAICGKTPFKPVVDHCHKSNRVRGLLRSHCNSVLGFALDNINTLNNAIRYLKN